MTDPIADMLTRIRNAQQRKHETVSFPFSKIKMGIARILQREGFILHCRIMGDPLKQNIELTLKYSTQAIPIISGLKRVSRPGCRVYVGKEAVEKVKKKSGVAILSTPKGLIVHRQARKAQVGGEVLCQVW